MDWKGDELVNADGQPASTQEKLAAALFGTAEAFIPFSNTGQQLLDKGLEGLNPAKRYAPEKVAQMRQPWETISVPAADGGAASSSSSNPWDTVDPRSVGNPWDSVEIP